MVKKSTEKFTLDGFDDVTAQEIERRTAYAKMRQLELSVLKDELTLADKAGSLCRIDAALDEFDAFLVDFVRLLRQMPDKVQEVVPAMSPVQYGELRAFIDAALQRLGEKRLHLTIESTNAEKSAATAAKNRSVRKNAKLDGGGDA